MRQRSFQLFRAILFFLAILSIRANARLYISEFMASNDSMLVDEDHDYSDWIEIYNDSNQAVDLRGWALTDEHDALDKWVFPSYLLQPRAFVVVFASGKNRARVDGELHTNFRLSSTGEYLALVDPSGEIQQDYFPKYPAQHTDISYGLQFTAPARNLIDEEHTFTYQVPNEKTYDEDWMLPGFDDSDWHEGSGPIGYADRLSEYHEIISTEIPEDTLSTFVRYHFHLNDTNIESLGFLARYDDGLVAYLNGKRVAAHNAPEEVRWNSTSTNTYEYENALTSDFKRWNITEAMEHLRSGSNVFAVHVLNRHGESADLLLAATLQGGGGVIDKSARSSLLAHPTPGRHNTRHGVPFTEPVRFSMSAGFYDDPFKLTLKTRTRGATIRYTLDGSEPTAGHGTVYTNDLSVGKTTILRARAFHPELQASDINTRTYIFIDDVIHHSPDGVPPGPAWPDGIVNEQVMDYGLDPQILEDPRYAPLITNALLSIPSYSLVADPEDLFGYQYGIYVNSTLFGPAWERPASIELLHPDGRKGFQANCGVRIRGGHSRWPHNPKHAFRLLFRGSYGDGHLAYPLFGDEGAQTFKNIDLRTSQNYSWAFENGERFTMVREVFSRDTQRDMGQPYTRSHYCHLYVNGHYWGLFQTQERSEASYAESYFGSHESNYDVVKIRGGIGRKFTCMATDGDLEAWRRLWEAMREGFETDEQYYRVLGCDADGSRNHEYEVLVDPANVIDYMLCTYYVGDPDGPVNPEYLLPNNFYAIRRRDGTQGFQFFRHDAEHSLDNLYENRLPETILGQDTFLHFNPKILHEHLLDHPDYRQLFIDRVYAHFFNDGPLTPQRCMQRFRARAERIEEAVVAESARWGDAQREKPYTRDDDWRSAITWVLEEYMPRRSAIVLQQFKDADLYPDTAAVTFSIRGGAVTNGTRLKLEAAEGVILYTTDGRDPRLLGGDAAWYAKSHKTGKGAATITIDHTMHVKARVLHKGEWSPLREDVFTLGTVAGSLRITELMYHPPAVPNRWRHDANDFEFIEMYNAGNEPVDLAGCSFTEGIEFTFPTFILDPKSFAVICANRNAFEARYGGRGVTVAGTYDGRLSNSGERVKMVDAAGNLVSAFSYEDSIPQSDGGGYSITLIHPLPGNPARVEHEWRASTRLLGTPGFSDGRRVD